MRKHVLAAVAALFLVMTLAGAAWAAAPSAIIVNGSPVSDSEGTEIVNGRTLVPLRVISENLGAAVDWDSVARKATVKKGDLTIEVTAGSEKGVVNGNTVAMGATAVIKESRMLVPLRFLAESFGAAVDWDQETMTVMISLDDPDTRDLSWGSTGDDVKDLQQKLTALGYDPKGIDGIFGANTFAAVTAFQEAQGLDPDGVVGSKTRTALNQAYALALAKQPSRGSRYGELMSWWKVTSLFKTGMVATVTDLDTGISYQVKRLGGTNHADVEPLTAGDTAKMLKIYGGEWSWARRAIIVSFGSYRIAASQNGMPHSVSTINDNNFPGHFCIHFLDSMTHGSNEWAPSPAHVDSAHQAMVKKAAGL